MGENQKNVLISLIVCVFITSTVWAIAWGTTIIDRTSIKAGLVQVEYVNYTGYEQKWVKPNENETSKD